MNNNPDGEGIGDAPRTEPRVVTHEILPVISIQLSRMKLSTSRRGR